MKIIKITSKDILHLSGVTQKRASILHQVIMHIILIAAILGIFLMASAGRTNSNEVRQQLLEKQLALFIDSAEPGMNFSVHKIGAEGVVSNLALERGKIISSVNGGKLSKGYPYFSKYNVGIEIIDLDGELNDKYVIFVR